MKIRKATIADLEVILDIFNYEIIHTPYVYLYEPWTMDYGKTWFKEKQSSGFPFFVAEINKEVVGYAYYSKFREKEAYRTTVEYSIYIHKDSRGLGAARTLLQALIEVAKKQNIHCLIGGVDAENKASLAFHERMGFTQVTYMKEVARKFDTWRDLVFYQMIL